ncbi:hypothetical protein ACFYKX_16830 [Cytobacillus sp. FJAT-54145]|uniref:YunG n=1 Tax=Cytobacillus spartinae TaxID=3299023 RepID=A0ABW6KFD2_9BACI
MEDKQESVIHQLQQILPNAWSIESSSKWSINNPAKGQCGVTSLVVNDLLGGEVLRTRIEESWHYYNQIDGKVCDLTASQFSEPITYMNIPSSREEAFSDTNEEQYQYLKSKVDKLMNKQNGEI